MKKEKQILSLNPKLQEIAGKMLRGVLIAGLLVFSLNLYAVNSRDIQFEKLSVEDGLSNNSILEIYQDSSGFIWIGTEDGLNRYDSYSFRKFNYIPEDSTSIDNNATSSLCKTSGDNFFLGTFAGINLYDSNREIFIRVPIYKNDSRINAKVYKILKISDNDYLAATAEGLFRFDPDSFSFKLFEENGFPHSVAISHITSLFLDDAGMIWIGTHNDGIYSYDRLKNKTIELTHYIEGKNSLRENKIIHINGDSKKNIWLSTNKGAYIFNTQNYTIKRFTREDELSPSGIADKSALFSYENEDKNVWILTRNGLSIYNPDNQIISHIFHDPFNRYSLSSNVLNVMYRDRQGNIWIGTQMSGINIIKQHSFKFNGIISRNLGDGAAPNDFVLSIFANNEGEIWLGTYGSGINVIDYQKSRFKNMNSANTPGLISDHIQSLKEDSKGQIWIGTYLGGITVISNNSKKNRNYIHDADNPNSLINDIVNHIYEDSKKRIWIASHGGLSVYIPEIDGFKNYSKNTAEGWDLSFANQICEASDGSIWVSTFNGLIKFNPEKEDVTLFKNSKEKNSISDNFVFCIYCDHKDRIWAGTLNGLNLFDPSTGGFKHFGKADGLPDNSVYSIIDDSHGNIWIASNYGLSKFNPETGLFVNFNKNDGLVHEVFYYNSVFKSKSGELYFGSRHGVVYFHPEDIDNIKIDNTRNIHLISLKIFDEYIKPGRESVLQLPLNETDKISLKYNESYISIDFTTFNYINPNSDDYSYFLEGYDYGWISLKNSNTLSYSRIPSGKYTLHIKSENNLTLSETTKALQINVIPPIWRSKISYVFYSLVLGVMIFFIYSYVQTRTAYKESLLVERMEREKVEAINQSKIRFFINAAHEFKTPLTLILSPLQKLLNQHGNMEDAGKNNLLLIVNRNAQLLSRLVNQIIDLRKIDMGSISLKTCEINLVSFLREIYNYFGDLASNQNLKFTFRSDFDSIVIWADFEKLEKVFLNLLSNAFRYTPEGKTIEIKISKYQFGNHQIQLPESPDGYVEICISDTGHGIEEKFHEKIFERFYQIEDASLANPSSSGIGLSIVKEYVELHGGKVTVKSEPGKGSDFIVVLPLGDSHLKPEEKSETSVSSFISNIKPIPDPKRPKDITPQREKGNTKILVVEDNYELRNYIVENLYIEYDVYEASDGEEGIKIAREVLPELIVSDVMMPKINGFQLCQAIKSDILTSHIPVILLTVLDSNENKIQGFEEGADDYLNKPFDMNLLMTRIKNLIDSRNLLRERFVSANNYELKLIAKSKADQVFIQKALDILNNNMANIDFSAEEFAREIGMSRSNLHLKMKALTNQSTTEFIRTFRLKEAGKLLSSNNYNISEVAYMVGFNNISYFNRCFKKLYNETPSQFLENINIQ